MSTLCSWPQSVKENSSASGLWLGGARYFEFWSTCFGEPIEFLKEYERAQPSLLFFFYSITCFSINLTRAPTPFHILTVSKKFTRSARLLCNSNARTARLNSLNFCHLYVARLSKFLFVCLKKVSSTLQSVKVRWRSNTSVSSLCYFRKTWIIKRNSSDYVNCFILKKLKLNGQVIWNFIIKKIFWSKFTRIPDQKWAGKAGKFDQWSSEWRVFSKVYY